MFTWLKIGVGVLAGLSIGFASGCVVGQRSERQAAAVNALTKSVEVLRSRGETDAEISAADAADLCRPMGLPDEDCGEFMRRVGNADADAGKRGEDHDGR